MGVLILKYGSEELEWDGCVLNPVDSENWLTATDSNNLTYYLRRFDALDDALAAKAALEAQISEGLSVAAGNGDVIVVIEDL